MDLTYGDDLWGSKRLRNALVRFFNQCVCVGSAWGFARPGIGTGTDASGGSCLMSRYFKPAEVVRPEQIITGKQPNDPRWPIIFTSFHPRTLATLSHPPGVGVSALLDQLFHAILDPGDSVLLLTPYYAGFDRDLVVGRSRVNLVGVDCQTPDSGSTGTPGYEEDRWDGPGGLGERFEKVYQDSISKGMNVSIR
jgi:1-aminocyclopropane-1-carboxylate synthase